VAVLLVLLLLAWAAGWLGGAPSPRDGTRARDDAVAHATNFAEPAPAIVEAEANRAMPG
jgi:hypothetical protein